MALWIWIGLPVLWLCLASVMYWLGYREGSKDSWETLRRDTRPLHVHQVVRASGRVGS
jgi:hypothetical protein